MLIFVGSPFPDFYSFRPWQLLAGLAGVTHGYCEWQKLTWRHPSQSHRYKVHNNIVTVRRLFFFCHRAATLTLFLILTANSHRNVTNTLHLNKIISWNLINLRGLSFLEKPRGKKPPGFHSIHTSSNLFYRLCKDLQIYSEVLSRSTTVPLLKKWRTISGITAASSR